MKQALLFLLKVAIAGVILWLIWDEFDPGQFSYVFSQPLLLSLLPACWVVNQLLVTARLQFILLALERQVEYMDVLRANLSALFFGNVVPGTVTVDIIKFFYIKQHDRNIPNTWLIMVFIMDRFVGLMSMLFWCSLLGMALFLLVDDYDAMVYWYLLPLVLLAGGIIGLLLALWLKNWLKNFRWSRPLVPLIEMADLLFARGKTARLVSVCLVSLAAVFVILAAMAVIGGILHLEVAGESRAMAQFFLVPLSLIASMIPLAPMGIGVSQFTISYAYQAFGLEPSVGVSVSTLTQLGMLVVSVSLGGYFFVKGRREVAVVDAAL